MKVKELCSGIASGKKDTVIKQAFWDKNYGNMPTASEWVNPKYYNLLFGEKDSHFNEGYWLSCRYVHLYDSSCVFGLYRMHAYSDSCKILGIALYSSNRLNDYI